MEYFVYQHILGYYSGKEDAYGLFFKIYLDMRKRLPLDVTGKFTKVIPNPVHVNDITTTF